MGETGLICHECGDSINLVEEVFCLFIKKITISAGRPTVEDPLADDGDYEYAPIFFCFSCWEAVEEELRSYARDEPPRAVHGSVVTCRVCKSGIPPNETIGYAVWGEPVVSRRMPDGIPTITFQNNDKSPRAYCGDCMTAISESVVELWTTE